MPKGYSVNMLRRFSVGFAVFNLYKEIADANGKDKVFSNVSLFLEYLIYTQLYRI